jgi:hypothetical protein
MFKTLVSLVFASAICVATPDALLAQSSSRVLTPKEREEKEKKDTWTSIGKVWSTLGAGNVDTSQRKDPQSRGPAFPRGFAGEVRDEVWTGTWVREACTEAGGAAGIGCAAQPVSGRLRLALARYGKSSFDGTAEVGEIEVFLAGVVGLAGSPMSASGYGRALTSDVTITNWRGIENGDQLTGKFTLTFHPDDPKAGTVIVRAAMQEMKKTAGKKREN